MAVALRLTSCALCLLLPASLAGPPSQSLRGQEGEGFRQLQAVVSLPKGLTTECPGNRFNAADPRIFSPASAHYPDVWTQSELLFLASDPDWTVGRTWTFSAKVTSASSSDALFAFAGEGSFFRVSVPPGVSFFNVTERVRRVDTLFQLRRSNLDGVVTFTDVCLAPRPALEPVEPDGACRSALEPDEALEPVDNAFLAPQPVVLSAGARNLAEVWFPAELSFLASNPEWTLGSRWTLTLLVSSQASSSTEFGFGGGGGFFVVSIPPGFSSVTKSDNVRRVNTVFQFRGSNLDGDVTFFRVCLRQS